MSKLFDNIIKSLEQAVEYTKCNHEFIKLKDKSGYWCKKCKCRKDIIEINR